MISVTTHKMFQPDYSDTMSKEEFDDYLLSKPRDEYFKDRPVRKIKIIDKSTRQVNP